MKVPISTRMPVFVLAALLICFVGCTGRSHMARVPDYSNMSDAGEVHADSKASTPLATVPKPASGSRATNIPWYYVVPVLALGLLGAAFVIRKRSGPSQTESEKPEIEVENEESAGPISPPETGDLNEFELTDSPSNWAEDDSELELDSVVLLDDDDPSQTGLATGIQESVVASQTGSLDSQSKIEQLQRQSEAARSNLEKALTKIGKLKSKLREKIRLIERLQSTSSELSEDSLASLSQEQLKEKLNSVNAELQLVLEKLHYTTDRNSKLKAKLREKVELIDVLRGVREEDIAVEEIENLSKEELRKRLYSVQKERADLKAELENVVDWNDKLKTKLREKLSVIEELSNNSVNVEAIRNGKSSSDDLRVNSVNKSGDNAP